MWHVLTSSKYTWSRKQIPEVEWDTQEETQPLELTHGLTHICCQQALAMINTATNDSLANLIVLWILTYPVLLVKALRLFIQLRNGHWVTDLCPTPTSFFVTQMDVRKEAGVTPLGDAYLTPPIWDRALGPPVISNIRPIKVFISQCNGNIFTKVTHMVCKICKRSNNTVLKATYYSARNTQQHASTMLIRFSLPSKRTHILHDIRPNWYLPKMGLFSRVRYSTDWTCLRVAWMQSRSCRNYCVVANRWCVTFT